MKISKEIIEINGTLYNDNSDTTYFLTLSCDGNQYSLIYDTTKYILAPSKSCNSSYPIIEKIPPKGKIIFATHFWYKTKVERINLGFDFFKVNKNFDLTKVKLNYNFIRKNRKKNIKWFETSVQ